MLPTLTHVAVRELAIRREVWIDERVAEPGCAGAAAAAGRAEAHHLAAEQRLQGPGAVTMIAMTVGDENMRHALAARRCGDSREMRGRRRDPDR